MITCKIAQNQVETQAAFDLRREVFVDEQGVPLDLEIDEFDPGALHAIAVGENGTVVGTGRLVMHDKKGKIGRIAVAKTHRRQGIATKIIQLLESEAKKRNIAEVYLHSQVYIQGLYRGLGYTARGDEFDDGSGIMHVEMFKTI